MNETNNKSEHNALETDIGNFKENDLLELLVVLILFSCFESTNPDNNGSAPVVINNKPEQKHKKQNRKR